MRIKLKVKRFKILHKKKDSILYTKSVHNKIISYYKLEIYYNLLLFLFYY